MIFFLARNHIEEGAEHLLLLLVYHIHAFASDNIENILFRYCEIHWSRALQNFAYSFFGLSIVWAQPQKKLLVVNQENILMFRKWVRVWEVERERKINIKKNTSFETSNLQNTNIAPYQISNSFQIRWKKSCLLWWTEFFRDCVWSKRAYVVFFL